MFSTIIRLTCIEKIRTRPSRDSAGFDSCIIKSSTDFKTCFQLFEQSNIKNTNFSTDMLVNYIEIPKKDSSKKRILGISNIIDRVIQLQFVTLLDPMIDPLLSTKFYGFRKGRNALQAIAYLSKSIQLSDLTRYHLLKVDIKQCFDNLEHSYILNNFFFPNKYKNLLIRWLKCYRIGPNGKKHRLQKGVSQGSVIGPLICNFVLSNVLKDFFNDKQFPKRPKLYNIKGNLRPIDVTRFIIGYADDLIIKVINVQEVNYSYIKLEKLLKTVGLNINKEKSTIHNLLEKSKFD